MDYYGILNLARNATSDEIKQAYRKLALTSHPDIVKTDKQEAEEKFKEINLAYDTLSDPIKRREYDRSHPPRIVKPIKKKKEEPKVPKDDLRIYDMPQRNVDLWGEPIEPDLNWKDSFGGRYEAEKSVDIR